MTERLPANEPAQLYTTAILVNLDGNILPLLRAKFGYLSKITPQGRIQFDLFGDFSFTVHEKQVRLMLAIDTINHVWGHNTIFFGAQGIRCEWQMRQEERSPRYTTRWDELFAVT